MFTSQPASSEDEELRRLFYVALTRAEQHLFISYCCAKNDGKELEPSMFIAEIRDEFGLPVVKGEVSDDVLDEFALLSFGDDKIPEIEKIEKEKSEVTLKFTDPTMSIEDITKWSKKLEELKSTQELKEVRWMELSEKAG
jgi:ATP-dependent exoDNAse (exonuclease V) beta subunit